MERITIDEVAKLAYVSRSVVSRVLNNHSNVSDEARRRVQEVIDKYGYTPSRAARSLVTNRSYEISVLGPRGNDEVIANGFWSLLLLGISETSIRRGYFVSLSMISTDMECAINRRILTGHHFDGYVLVSKQIVDLVAPSLLGRGIPGIVVGHHPQRPDLSYVDVDNSGGVREATEYLAGLGHRRIGVITGDMETQETRDRFAGYLRAMRAAGLTVEPGLIVEGDYSERSGFAAMNRLLAGAERPTAVLCMCDAMAVGAILALHEAGLSVPGDCSVVGFDDLPFASFTHPPLTTIRQPIYEMGGLVAGILIDAIEGIRSRPAHRKLDVQLVMRQTCAPPAA